MSWENEGRRWGNVWRWVVGMEWVRVRGGEVGVGERVEVGGEGMVVGVMVELGTDVEGKVHRSALSLYESGETG
ncbi:hypothetical protein, partial [Corynebacterium glyciniphilum]|uniref:hypothetical protein n=1 Tax=Corynebacterium glyciniphilum TaxID=1404244 RepID=UPI0011AB5616